MCIFSNKSSKIKDLVFKPVRNDGDRLHESCETRPCGNAANPEDAKTSSTAAQVQEYQTYAARGGVFLSAFDIQLISEAVSSCA
jgi:hypothetical protein